MIVLYENLYCFHHRHFVIKFILKRYLLYKFNFINIYNKNIVKEKYVMKTEFISTKLLHTPLLTKENIFIINYSKNFLNLMEVNK